MFKKILIANRGEIACRVIKTARRMGIATVAVYSEADKDAPHVSLADEAVLLGPPPSAQSYLLGDKIIAAAQASGAQAIHPGYGFLSENAAFSKAVEDAGLVFIGPKHASIAAMGDKIASKKLAQEAGVSTIPGWNDPIDTADDAVRIARDIGYPVMIKASAGGGGKGLRVAWDDAQAREGYTSCRNEARNSFGDDRVFIEKFVEEPRHIEIQVLGDGHGHTLYLWERECSIQRRHQKVIEEAPSPFISEATRRAMGEQAVALARAVNYQSAGTVEFVVGKDQSFYFLEMNTRLQVEHPVTECITGLDLVEWMIRIAAGETLTLQQDQLRRDGWAIECRINAEDPYRNFLPSTGRLVQFQPPPTDLQAGQSSQASGRYGVRVDTGVTEGGEIPMFYDSMIAKLIVHGRDRADAIARMRQALDAFVIRGVGSNVPFQAALLAHPQFVAGQFNTGFIAEHYPDGFRVQDQVPGEDGFLLALAAAINRRYQERAAGITGQVPGHGFRPTDDQVVAVRDPAGLGWRYVDAVVRESDPAHPAWLSVAVQDREHLFKLDWRFGQPRVSGTVDGVPFVAQLERHGLLMSLSHQGTRLDAMVLPRRAAELHALMPVKQPPDTSQFLLSPMPGLLAAVAVTVGQEVRAGERLAVVEAMKMENVLLATQDVTVAEILAEPGSSLAVDQPILRFE